MTLRHDRYMYVNSPYIFNTLSSRKVMRIGKLSTGRYSVWSCVIISNIISIRAKLFT